MPRSAWLFLPVLLASSCFDPPGTTCGPSNACPSGQVCSEGTCVAGPDAGAIPDAGQEPRDAGPTALDAGEVEGDAGQGGADAAHTEADAGQAGVDSGQPRIDAGTPQGACVDPANGALRPAGTECRAAQGPCDVPEVCDGVATTCPVDLKRAAAFVCRAAAGTCDVAETCDGTGSACPGDAFASAATTCRPSAGLCDVAEACTGTSAACPADAKASTATVCRFSAGPCDLPESCDGSNAACPSDAKVAQGVVCRPAAAACDLAETCDGTGAACPGDAFAGAATVCRASAGLCDVAETCTGTGPACPSDAVKTAAEVCRPAAGTCDLPESCTGSSPVCPADAKAAQGVTCRAVAGVCDLGEVCDGVAAACPADVTLDGSMVCRDSLGPCDPAERCDGAAATCPTDVRHGASVTCRPKNGGCDAAEVCDPSSAACPDDGYLANGTVCRAVAGVCDLAEVCSGSSPACPADAFQTALTVCRVAAPVCGLAQYCPGNAADCPPQAVNGPPAVPATLVTTQSASAPHTSVLSWATSLDPEGNTVAYYAQLSTAADMSAVVANSGWIAGTSWTTPTLSPSTTYYWRAQARDTQHVPCESDWSAIQSFTTSLPAPVPTAQATVVYPCGTTPAPTWSGSLAWAAVTHPNPVSYKFQISLYSNFSSLLVDGAWQSATTFPVSLGYGYYYWRVQARDDTTLKVSVWSTLQQFAVTDDCPTVSCPYVYSWNGQEYAYETDIAGSPLVPGGATVRYFIPRYVPLGNLVADSNGALNVKLREALAEMDYIDQVEVVAVDHPPEAEIFTSTTQNVAEFGRIIPFEFHTATHAVPPIAATNSLGADVLAAVLDRDDVTAPMERSPGYFYTFEFGPVAFPENAKLIIDGWTFPYAKPGFPLTEPTIQVVDAGGNWVDVAKFGWPSGDLKSFVVPLPDVFPTADRRLRVYPGGNAAIAWVIDRVRLDDSAPVGISSGATPAVAADLHWRGPVVYTPSSPFRRIHAQDEVGTLNPNNFGYGAFTRYGDVLPLMQAADDLYAAMRYGDELTLSFRDFGPPLPGTVRSYFLKTDYWYKGFKAGRTLEPLPFHGMTSYPYAAPEQYPTDAAHQNYLSTYNTRVEGR